MPYYVETSEIFYRAENELDMDDAASIAILLEYFIAQINRRC
jgi:hypothetical protein